MKNKVFTFLVIVALMVFPVMTVFADDYTGGDDWSVDWDGTDMTSTFETGQINDLLSEMQPGDTLTVDVAINNSAKEEADMWLKNDVVNSFEDNEKASGGAYTYKLTYKNTDGSDIILYASETVGGEDPDEEAGAGLYQADSATEEFFYLERMPAGKSGTVTLEVSLDGETQGNIYQNTMAKLELTFAAEAYHAPTHGEPTEPDTPDENPNTGDLFDPIPWCIAGTIAGLVLLFLGLGRMKREKKEGADND